MENNGDGKNKSYFLLNDLREVGLMCEESYFSSVFL